MMQHSSGISSLTDHLGYWMRMVSNHVSYAFARKLEGQGATVAEWVFLRTLYDSDALVPSRLAEQMGMTRGAISKLADRLLEKQLIERTDSPDDARTHRLGLTAEGKRLVPALAKLADENDASFFDDLTTEERAAMEAMLKKIAGQRGLKDIPLA